MFRRSRLGAWIEIKYLKYMQAWQRCRSRLGAWIEMCGGVPTLVGLSVAPVWERGLK